ncbi:phosphorylase family protein [Streptomyces griseus]|uniref:phosphorylase family protein n=1 Tax=Streptomyces griseus TaxID=1911 RepID=UPI00379C8BD6
MLTALQVEYEAVHRHMVDHRTVELPEGTLLDVGRIPGLNWEVALAETGPTNTRAALVTQSAIGHFDAEAVLFVGVAGALKDDIRLGDVVVASKVHSYHGGRESLDGFSARPDTWSPEYAVDQLVRSACRNEPWALLLPGPRPATPPKVHFAPIASGDVLLGNRDSETARRIRRHYNDAVAIDMESHGVTQATRMNRAVRALTIRGISDFADPDKSARDAAGSQETASRHAAAFAMRVLRDLRPQRQVVQEPRSAPAVVVVSAPDRSTRSAAWGSRPVLDVAGQQYLLYEGPGDLVHESRDGDVLRRQAVARVVPDGAGRGAYAWLRQVERTGPPPGPDQFDPLAALEREAELCRRLHGPGVVQLTRSGKTATLALAWPDDPKFGSPLGTVHELLPESPTPTDPHHLWSLVKGLADIAQSLERLSGAGYSHRALRPTAVVMHRPRMVLRDFGLATVPPRRGENAGPYQAPEQRHGSRIRPGPATDVYQLGALLHRALTGRIPDPGLPAYRGSDSVPDSLVHAVASALREDPATRPGAGELRLDLITAALELASVPPPSQR